MNKLTIFVQGKCSDLGYTAIYKDDDIVFEKDGYIPRSLGIGGGDYIELEIDVETGMVVNWGSERVKATIAKLIEDNDED
jgi:hypothetical protein